MYPFSNLRIIGTRNSKKKSERTFRVEKGFSAIRSQEVLTHSTQSQSYYEHNILYHFYPKKKKRGLTTMNWLPVEASRGFFVETWSAVCRNQETKNEFISRFLFCLFSELSTIWRMNSFWVQEFVSPIERLKSIIRIKWISHTKNEIRFAKNNV